MAVSYQPNANGYLALPITITATQIYQNAINAIAARLPGWVPHEGNIDNLLLEQFAAMCAESAQVAANVPLAIFMYFGSLLGINPLPGGYASMPTTWTMVDAKGYQVPAGTILGYAAAGNTLYAFQTTQAFTVLPGYTTAGNIPVQSTAIGSLYNNLTPAPLVMVTQLAFVQSVVSTAPSDGGADPETQAAYINRLSFELQLLTPRPILPPDFADLATNIPGVFRAVALDLLSPGRTIASAGLTINTKLLTDPAGTFTNLDIGRTVTGTGVPATTTVVSVPTTSIASGSQGALLPQATIYLASIPAGVPTTGVIQVANTGNSFVEIAYTGISGNELTGCSNPAGGNGTELTTGMLVYFGNQATMSLNATATETAESVVLSDLTDVERTVTLAAVDVNGNAITGTVAAQLSAYMQNLREVNFIVNVIGPTYNPIDVSYAAVCYPGYDPTLTQAAITAALNSFLSQATWGILPGTAPPEWDPDATTVYLYDLVTVIGETPGVQHVTSVLSCAHGGTLGTSDISLVGDAPLTQAGSIGGTVTVGT